MTNFSDLGLNGQILKALETEGYVTPTPIQAQAIPVVMEGKDLLGIAQTGTGKTAAFALPMLHRLATTTKPRQRKMCRALILSPTRELSSQIADSFRTYGRHLGLSVAVVFGGVGHRPQKDTLARGVDILVATPGRLLDHLGEGNVTLSGTEIFVLDEADQMLDLGFLQPIKRIVSHLSDRRQSLFFSATMPGEIGKLADQLLKDPTKVAVTPVAATADRVEQRIIHVDRQSKRTVLVDLFADEAMARTLVFTRTKRGADRVATQLETAGIPVASIHGNKSQRQREVSLEAFRNNKIRVLVATDIAARGIDVDGVTHVVNFELPDVPESYVHRIGRTARAGASGIAISLVDGEEIGLLRQIERLTRKTIPSEDRRTDKSASLEAGESSVERDPRRGSRQGDRRSGDRQNGRRDHRDERGAPRRDARPHRGEGDRPHREARPHRAEGDRPHREARPHRAEGDRPHREARPHRGEGDRPHREARPHRAEGDRPHREARPHRAEGDRPHRDARPHRGEAGERSRSARNPASHGERDSSRTELSRVAFMSRPAPQRRGEQRDEARRPSQEHHRHGRSPSRPSQDGQGRGHGQSHRDGGQRRANKPHGAPRHAGGGNRNG